MKKKWWISVEIRHIKIEDAEEFLNVCKKLDQETTFMLYEPNERQTTVEGQRQQFERILSDHNSTILVATVDSKIVGYIALFGNKLQRIKHSAYIVTGILQSYAGKGIGTKLFEEGIEWAKLRNFHRLELTVMVHNVNGIGLYEKMGFEREGIKRHSLRVNGEWVDEYYYSYLMEE